MNLKPTPSSQDDAATRDAREARLAGLAEQAAREDAPDPAPELARDPNFQRLLLRRRLSHLALLVGAVPTPGMIAELASGASAAEANSADALALAARAMLRASSDRAEGAPPADETSAPEQVRMALVGARAVYRAFPFPMLAPQRTSSRPKAFAMIERSKSKLWRMEIKPGSSELMLPQGMEAEPAGLKKTETKDLSFKPEEGAVEIDRIDLPDLGEARLLWRDVPESESIPAGSVWADPLDPSTPMDSSLRSQLSTRALPLLSKLPYAALSSRLSARRAELAAEENKPSPPVQNPSPSR